MRKFRLLALFVFVFGLVYVACRKVDQVQLPENSPAKEEAKFFSSHPSSEPAIQAGIQFVRGENSKHHFVSNLLSRIGVPHWDKSLVASSHQGRQNDLTDSSTFLYIPFVRDSQYYVNAALIIKMAETDTTFKILLDADYIDTAAIPEWSPRDVMNLFATLEKSIFDHNKFEILDSLLLTTEEINAIHTTGKGFNDFFVTYTFTPVENTGRSNIFVQGLVCNDVTSCVSEMLLARSSILLSLPACPPGSMPFTTEQCTNTWIYIPYSGGGGTGGGTGSGGGTWNPGPIGGSGPTGWQILLPEPSAPPEYPNSPCVVVDSLLRTTWFPQHLNRLRDSTVLTYESGISFTLPDTSGASHDYYTGQGTLAVNITPPHPVDGIIHNHYDTAGRHTIFSAEDLTVLAQHFVQNKIKDIKNFTFTLVTDSSSYIIMIEDSAKFRNFINTWLNSDKHMRDFSTLIYDQNNVAGEGLSIAQKEKNFLKAMKKAMAFISQDGIGLKLFRGNSDMSVFTPIRLNANDQVRSAPCN